MGVRCGGPGGVVVGVLSPRVSNVGPVWGVRGRTGKREEGSDSGEGRWCETRKNFGVEFSVRKDKGGRVGEGPFKRTRKLRFRGMCMD